MGWSSANEIFDPVARALIDTGADDTTKRKVLGDLISGLQDGDWDTEDESLERFLDDPAIVAAFHDHRVHTQDRGCCLQTTLNDAQDRITIALAERFAGGGTEDYMGVKFRNTEGCEVTRPATPQEAAEVAINAIRDLITTQRPA